MLRVGDIVLDTSARKILRKVTDLLHYFKIYIYSDVLYLIIMARKLNINLIYHEANKDKKYILTSKAAIS